jgi:putative SOS response-associated peptidase YedK
MCGRYVITSAPEAIRALFRYWEQPDFPPRYNIAPTQPVPTVRLDRGVRSFALVRWGFIPAWVKDPRNFTLLINARSESMADKAAFRNAMARRRCLFPADGFYEWQAGGAKSRPYFVRPRSGGPIAFAGLWETWMGPNGEEVETACIVTTAANRVLAPIHDRMPAVIAPEAFDMWFDCGKVDSTMAAALIAPAPEDLFEAYEISTAVNRATNDSPELVAPLDPAPSQTPASHVNEERNEGTAAAPRSTARRKKNDGQMSLF